MKPRILAQTIQKAIRSFPAIVVTGPRQSGKTTLLKMLFAKSPGRIFLGLEPQTGQQVKKRNSVTASARSV